MGIIIIILPSPFSGNHGHNVSFRRRRPKTSSNKSGHRSGYSNTLPKTRTILTVMAIAIATTMTMKPSPLTTRPCGITFKRPGTLPQRSDTWPKSFVVNCRTACFCPTPPRCSSTGWIITVIPIIPTPTTITTRRITIPTMIAWLPFGPNSAFCNTSSVTSVRPKRRWNGPSTCVDENSARIIRKRPRPSCTWDGCTNHRHHPNSKRPFERRGRPWRFKPSGTARRTMIRSIPHGWPPVTTVWPDCI
mmetsp:Transcript_21591/g.59923  ORF Transcript_21591/g.59923 Transcript_21591/m.59923 type:complete len:247 (+) Transcript_21591:342-1082(+)